MAYGNRRRYRARAGGKRRGGSKTKGYRGYKRKQWKKSVRAIAKSVVSRKSETKTVLLDQSNSRLNSIAGYAVPIPYSTSGWVINAPTNMFSIIPFITVGNGQGQRIGNAISNLVNKMVGRIHLDPAKSTESVSGFGAQRVEVRVSIVSSKVYKFASDLYANWGIEGGTLFQYGNVSIGWTPNNPQCQFYKINKDRFNVYYDKKFVLTAGSQTNGTGVINYNNSSEKSYRGFSSTFIRKIVKFDDTNFGNSPTNFHEPVLLIHYNSLTSGASATDPLMNNVQYLRLAYVNNATYKDM